jgi:hypothetical protein
MKKKGKERNGGGGGSGGFHHRRHSKQSRLNTTYILRTCKTQSRSGAEKRKRYAYGRYVKSVAEFSESWVAKISKSECDV